MLRRGLPSLRRALLSSASTHHGRAQISNPSHSPPQALLPQWRRHASVAFSSAPPPQQPPPPSPPSGPSLSGGGGPGVSSLNPAEVAKFAAIAETWWDSNGPFKPLHLMNPIRLSFIRSTLCRHFRRDPYSSKPLEGLKVIDVGCGGGILSEPLARMGATVTAIDAVDKNIKIASIHAASDPTTASIEYCCTTAEELVKEKKLFDAVISLEVIEHVANPLEFCGSLSALTVPNGATVVSTINRSMRAYATAIVAAEYILRWLPKGTHEWSKLVTPEELALMLQKASVSVSIGLPVPRGDTSCRIARLARHNGLIYGVANLLGHLHDADGVRRSRHRAKAIACICATVSSPALSPCGEITGRDLRWPRHCIKFHSGTSCFTDAIVSSRSTAHDKSSICVPAARNG